MQTLDQIIDRAIELRLVGSYAAAETMTRKQLETLLASYEAVRARPDVPIDPGDYDTDELYIASLESPVEYDSD